MKKFNNLLTFTGYEGERSEYKITCQCRKPAPGLLLQAANDYHIDLTKSWMIGDSDIDVEAGKAAGCQTILLSEQISLSDAVDTAIKDNAISAIITIYLEELILRYPQLPLLQKSVG